MIIWLYIKLRVTIKKRYFIKMLSTVLFLEKKILKSIKKSSPVMLIWFNKIPFYHLKKGFMKIISTLHWLFNFSKI